MWATRRTQQPWANSTFGGLPRVTNDRVDAEADQFEVALSTKANLAALAPVFAQGTIGNTATVPEGTGSMTATPTSAETLATIRVIGTVATSGTASGAIPQNLGNGNTITVTVPLDGRPVYVTIRSLINGAYQSGSASFTTANTATGDHRSLMTALANGATLSAASTTSTWGGGSGLTSQAL